MIEISVAQVIVREMYVKIEERKRSLITMLIIDLLKSMIENVKKTKEKKEREVNAMKEKTSVDTKTSDEIKQGTEKPVKSEDVSKCELPQDRRPSVEHEDPSIVSVTAQAKDNKNVHFAGGRTSPNKNARKPRPEIKIYRPPSERSSNTPVSEKQSVEKKSTESTNKSSSKVKYENDDKDSEKHKEKEKHRPVGGRTYNRDRYRDERSSYSNRDRYNKYDRFDNRRDNRYENREHYADRFENRRKPDRRVNRYDREKDTDKPKDTKIDKEFEKHDKNNDKQQYKSSEKFTHEKVSYKPVENKKESDKEKEREKELEQERYRRNWIGKE